MLIHDTNSTKNETLHAQQRAVQRRIEQPLLYFFSSDYNSTLNATQKNQSQSLLQLNYTLAQSPVEEPANKTLKTNVT